MPGTFITFEGVEGAGKSTQIALLRRRLESRGDAAVVATREPGEGALGAELRRLVLHPPPGLSIDPRAELLIMEADRAQHVAHIIRPALQGGAIVLCDRYADSSLAYQGYGRGLALAEIRALNDFATGGLVPDLTILIELDPAVGLIRQRERTRMEAEALAFHARVHDGFQDLAVGEPQRFFVVDGAQTTDTVAAVIWSRVAELLRSA